MNDGREAEALQCFEKATLAYQKAAKYSAIAPIQVVNLLLSTEAFMPLCA